MNIPMNTPMNTTSEAVAVFEEMRARYLVTVQDLEGTIRSVERDEFLRQVCRDLFTIAHTLTRLLDRMA